MVKPLWIRSEIPKGVGLKTRKILSELKLNTVCVDAKCPNLGECWGCGTATFMILGNVCTRNCRFCAVDSNKKGQDVSKTEADRIAKAVIEMDLRYVVLTSVDRDDLFDYGAQQFIDCIKKLKKIEGILVEALTPDFNNKTDLIRKVCESGLDVFAHNIETVKDLSPSIRDSKSSYKKSLAVLETAKSTGIVTKSSILLGLGEDLDQLSDTMDDLRSVEVDILVLGQYLQPTKKNIPVNKYYSPKQFNELKEIALSSGFKYVVSKPMARTSYKAAIIYDKLNALNG